MNLKNIMLKPRLGLYEKAINDKFSLEEKLSLAKEAGFDYLELSIDEKDFRLERLNWSEEDLDELLKIKTKVGFWFASICLSGHRRFPFGSKDPQKQARAYEIMRRAIYIAWRLGIPVIQLASYDVYYEESSIQSRKDFAKGMAWATKEAERYNVILAFETMDTKFLSTISRAMKYVKQNASHLLNVYPDLGNLWQFTSSNEERSKEIAVGKGHYVGFHFKSTQPGVFRDLAWEKSNVDYLFWFQELVKIDYQGPFVIEMWSQNALEETYQEALVPLKAARAFFLEKWNKSHAN